MYWGSIKFFLAVVCTTLSLQVSAGPIIGQYSLFVSNPDGDVDPVSNPFGDSWQDDQINLFGPPVINNFADGGYGVSFQNNLAADGYGSVTWQVTNNTGADLASRQIMGFLDADLDAGLYYEEYGTTEGVLSNDYNSWEIDEPGFFGAPPGDIYLYNLLLATLDNTNARPVSSPDDISLALGFLVTDWLAGETISATFNISSTLPTTTASLGQFSNVVGDVLYFSGSIQRAGAAPEPATLLLFALGCLGLVATTKNRM